MVRKYNVRFGKDGRLHGRLLLPDTAYPMPGAILCHGLGSGLGAVSSSAASIARRGIAALIFDFRGHGRSKGIFDGGEVEDVVEAYRWLAQHEGISRERIALIGHSMGARAAILAACQIDSTRAVVALSSPVDPDERLNGNNILDLAPWVRKGTAVMEYPADGMLPWLKGVYATVGWIWMYLRGYRLRVDWDRYFKSLPDVKISTALQNLDNCPKLFVHCRGDNKVPYQALVELYQEAPEPKDLLLAQGGYHSTPLLLGNLRRRWIRWLIAHLTSENETDFYG